jgi:teichuronic acid biosynthesis glycosyltransferase TuaG
LEVNLKKEPLVSVIIPLYNAEKYIKETIESVINQTYQNWELIVVDDRSTDSSRDVVNKLAKKDHRIKLIESETNFGGPARPRNIGIDNAKGEYIAFLDADDVWLEQKLEKQINFFQQNKDSDICHTLANVIDENSIVQEVFNNQKVYRKLKSFISQKNILFYTNNININSVMMRANTSLKFDEDQNLVALEDWKYWIDSQKLDKEIVLINETLLKYRVHQSSISNRASDKGYRKALYMLSKIFLDKNISGRHFFFSVLLHLFKIKIKNVTKN